jgi:pilus assembly protein CpaB
MALLSNGTRRALARFDGRPRKAAAIICVALALASALLGHRAQPAAGESILVAAHDLAAGTQLVAADLKSARWPHSVAPPGAIRTAAAAIGERTGAPIGRGEALTSARLLGRDPLSGLSPGQVAVMVPTGIQGLVLRAGDVVDVYARDDDPLGLAAPDASGSPDAHDSASLSTRVIAASRILAIVPPGAGRQAPAASYALIAVDEATAARFAATPTTALTVVLRGG